MLSWNGYEASAAHGSVVEQLDSANEKEIKERREYLSRVVAVTKFLGKQNIPFRGHDEGISSDNHGNFLECINLLKEFDPFLQSYSAPSHCTYLSPSSQNEVIQCCAQEIAATIVREIKEAGMFSVMADEARDGSTEQLAVCVRYVAEGSVKEHLLAMTELKGFDAESVTAAIEEQLRLNGIDHVKVVAQAYDGASVMSGPVGGVQAKFRENHPMAIYVHCYAHQLNLVLCYTCQAIPEAKDLFDLLQSVYTFFSVSLVNHHKFKETQKQLGLQPSELVQLSKTRWSCQLRSVNAMIDNLPAVLQCLSSINNPMAVGLHVKLARFSTVYLLMMFKTFLSVTENLHKYLQSQTVDLAKAEEYKCAVCATLKDMRSDEKAAELYDRAKAYCAANQIPESCAVTRQRQKQKRVEDYVVDSSCGVVSDLGNAEKLKTNLYLPCLDRMVAEMDQRFSSLNSQVLKGVQACNPGSDNFLCEEDLRGLADHYNVDLKPEEVLVAKNYLARKRESLPIADMQSVFSLLDQVMFPTLTQVIQISLTIPVSSCTCERTFSVLRRLHTWLRSTMGQDRLHHLAIMSVEREELSKFSHGQVIDHFAKMKTRRYSLLLRK
ncbi:Zinc finger MYM-type protein 1 [Merluccius polli]|uniref:Zinc finger MYM-type protein 1 n=1 Tax=Merluccius polli TaxID=89951 RepID=A0AA47MEM8_MERPO|nr:Zinc finger MYM-type protein 1 [Merluccius polli]